MSLSNAAQSPHLHLNAGPKPEPVSFPQSPLTGAGIACLREPARAVGETLKWKLFRNHLLRIRLEPRRKRLPRWATVREAAVFLGFTVFFLAYGQTPLLGGDGLGLVGADEPRYAQIAHEMLARFDSAPLPSKAA